MPMQPENESSDLKKDPQSRQATYFDMFGKPVKASEVKFAANRVSTSPQDPT